MKNKKGFTFIESMVTLMIIITLSLLSFPLYTGRAGGNKSKLAEGYALLGYVVNAQVAYFNEFGYFLAHGSSFFDSWGTNAFTSKDPVLGISAINNRYFTSFNAYGNNVLGYHTEDFKYHFTAIVRSAKAGTISLEYNLTKRFEPVVSGV